jgi:Branched-chain amino acid ABC-type transport system, permease components
VPALSGEVLVTLLIIGLVGDILRRLLVGIIGGPYLASVVIEGVTIGLAYGLAGIGLSMTYSILSFANFAHGDTMTIGAMSGWSVAYLIGGIGTATLGELVLLDANPGLSITASFGVIIVGVIAAGVLTAGLTVLVDRLVYRPMRRADGIPLLIASIGVALAFRYLAAFFYGTDVMGHHPAIGQARAAAGRRHHGDRGAHGDPGRQRAAGHR